MAELADRQARIASPALTGERSVEAVRQDRRPLVGPPRPRARVVRLCLGGEVAEALLGLVQGRGRREDREGERNHGHREQPPVAEYPHSEQGEGEADPRRARVCKEEADDATCDQRAKRHAHDQRTRVEHRGDCQRHDDHQVDGEVVRVRERPPHRVQRRTDALVRVAGDELTEPHRDRHDARQKHRVYERVEPPAGSYAPRGQAEQRENGAEAEPHPQRG